MWLGIIMILNVWGIIWPNQKRALGIVEADADAKAKAGAGRHDGLAHQHLLSLPMLVAMTMIADDLRLIRRNRFRLGKARLNRRAFS